MTALEIFSGSPSAEPSIPVLETKRLVLRAPRLEDMDQIAALANNRKIAEMTCDDSASLRNQRRASLALDHRRGRRRGRRSGFF